MVKTPIQPTIVKWRSEPERHDFPAAQSYLRITFSDAFCRKKIACLKTARVVLFKAKDLFRASGLSLLGVSNIHIEKDRYKIKHGIELSPLLLVRYKGRVVIVDGYHRLCAVYSFDEDAEIPAVIV